MKTKHNLARDITDTLKTAGTMIGVVSIGAALGFGVAGVVIGPLNYATNNKTREFSYAKVISRPHFIIGHTDLIMYNNGSREMVNFPGIGTRIGRTEIYTDKDGDGDIDEIKEFAGGWRFQRMISYIDAEKEYLEHKDKIDEANKKYQQFLRDYVK